MAVTLQRVKPWTPAPWNSGLGLYPEYPHLDAPARYCFIVTTDHPLKPAFSHREGAYSRRTQNERNHRLSTPTLLVRHKPSYVGHLPDVLGALRARTQLNVGAGPVADEAGFGPDLWSQDRPLIGTGSPVPRSPTRPPGIRRLFPLRPPGTNRPAPGCLQLHIGHQVASQTSRPSPGFSTVKI